MTSEKLAQAVQLIKSGNKIAALPILKEIVQAEPDNENAWLLLHSCVEKVEQKKYCLQQALRINPNNQDTRNALLKLESQPPVKPQSVNREIDTSVRPSIDPRVSEKRSTKKSQKSVPTLLVGLLTIGVFCLAATLFFLFAQRNASIFGNLPFLSSAKFESVTGNPSGYSECSTCTMDYYINNPPTPIHDITLKIKYPIEMSQGETVKLIVTCKNNSNQPIENLRAVVWGKSSVILGQDANYFDGINVSSTDPQIIDSGTQIEGLLVYFNTGPINSGETKEVSLNVAAITVGGYRGQIDILLDIPGKELVSYEIRFLTSVK